MSIRYKTDDYGPLAADDHLFIAHWTSTCTAPVEEEGAGWTVQVQEVILQDIDEDVEVFCMDCGVPVDLVVRFG